MDAIAFLKSNPKRHPVYALSGDEDFLKRQARERIIASVLGEDEPAFAVSTYSGDQAAFSTIRNELDTLPFLASCRVVVIESADAFITENRPLLEQYLGKASSAGILILEAKSFPDTTRLAKQLPDTAKVVCKTPWPDKLAAWCIEWAKSHHQKKLKPEAAEALVERVGSSMGMLDQEVEKLATAVGTRAEIGQTDVDRFVPRSKSADVFRILDSIGEGKPTEALSILETLFTEGDDPLAILGALTAQLRKLAAVGRHSAEGMALGPAMDAANVPTWPKARKAFERLLMHLGRRRLYKLIPWLVEINQGVKGGNALPSRVQLERLVVQLARPREEVNVV